MKSGNACVAFVLVILNNWPLIASRSVILVNIDLISGHIYTNMFCGHIYTNMFYMCCHKQLPEIVISLRNEFI